MAVPPAIPVILLGLAATTQNHLAKALERQGIEVYDLLQARLRGSGEAKIGARKPLIYLVGLLLNHTIFVYHLLVAPLGGTTALYTGMYGAGLIALLLYSRGVMKEELSRPELFGALAIVLGTLAVGVDGIARPAPDMAALDLGHTLAAVGVLLAGCAALLAAGLKNGAPNLIGLAFGFGAGTCGCLDPFLKTVGQTAGGSGRLAPNTLAGWGVLASSFVIGTCAFLITQWGFIRRARANVLVPAYNCTYVLVPVALQALLLPGYAVSWAAGLGLALIAAGTVLMRALRPAAGHGREG